MDPSVTGLRFDYLYASTHAALDGPETQLRAQNHSQALAAGSSDQVTNTVTIPANAPPAPLQTDLFDLLGANGTLFHRIRAVRE